MSKLSKFLDDFWSMDKIKDNDTLTAFLISLQKGCFVRNDDKFRLEFWSIPTGMFCGEGLIGWIDYASLAPNPKTNLEAFINYRLNKRIKPSAEK